MSYLFAILFLIVSLIFPCLSAYADSKPVINEFLAHPSTGNKEWVELYVPDGVDVTNDWIDDDTDFASDTGSSSKKQITAVIAGSDSRHVVFELSSAMFNNGGDTVTLFASDGSLIDSYIYTSDPGSDIAIGRSPDATGNFQILASATRGSPNSNPQPTATPTPAPTDKPTKEPKPTETPKPQKNTVVTSPVTDKSVLSDSTTVSSIKKSIASPTQVSSGGAHPTSILGASTPSPTKKSAQLPKQPILIKGASSSLPQMVALSAGGLLLLGCGILLYLKKQGIWIWRRETE